MLNYKKQIILPMIVSSIFLIAGLSLLFYANYHLSKMNALHNKLDDLRFKMQLLDNAIVKTESGQRGFLLTNNLTFVSTFTQGQADIGQLTAEIGNMLTSFDNAKSSYLRLEKYIKVNLNNMTVGIQIEKNYGGYSPHLNSIQMGTEVSILIENELKQVNAILQRDEAEIQAKIKQALNWVLTMGAVLLVLIVGTLFYGYRRAVTLYELAANSKSEADKFTHVAYHDALTLLPNRRFFNEHIQVTLESSKKHGQVFALFYLDLDGFKYLNDHYGHEAGDEALRHIAMQLKLILRDTDFLARLGGDEFAIIVQVDAAHEALERLAQRIIDQVGQPFLVGDKLCLLGVSIGIASYPKNESDVEKLTSAADDAMYQAKRAGKNRAIFA
jgi:diguanylate cyclase (GGDEF)-like protein